MPSKPSLLALFVTTMTLWLLLVGAIWAYTSGAIPSSPISFAAMLCLIPFAGWIAYRTLTGERGKAAPRT